MALFRSDRRAALAHLRKRDWKTAGQRDELLQNLANYDLKLGEYSFAFASRDRVVRSWAVQLARKQRDPATFEEIFRLAQRGNDAKRAALIPLLTEWADKAALTRLGTVVREDEGKDRALAVEVLLAFPLERARDYVYRLLRHPERDIRYRALRKITEHETEAVDPSLRRHLMALVRDGEERIRMTALRVLGEGPDDEILDLLIQRIRVESPGVQRVIAQLLDALADAHDPRLMDRLVPVLSDGNDRLRGIAIRLLFKVGDPTDLIRRIILYSKTLMGWMRERIHQTVGAYGEQVIDPVIALMSHEKEDIRNAALIFATHFTSKRLVPPLIQLVNDTNWWTRVIAIETLGTYKDERAADALIQCLTDEEVRWSAVEALANIASSKALSPIAHLLRDSASDVRREVIRALEVYNDRRALPLLEQCFKSDPELGVREQALNAYRAIAKHHEVNIDEDNLRGKLQAGRTGETALDRLLIETRKVGASDLHIMPGSPPVVRIDGELRLLGDNTNNQLLSDRKVRKMLAEVLDDDERRGLGKDRQIDTCYEVADVGRYRANIYLHMWGMGAVFRVIPNEIPDIEYTRLPTFVVDIVNEHRGLVLISGAAGTGKTTTLAALVNLINEHRRAHIITVEDPIEFVHPYRNCLLNQRAVGKDSKSFPAALRAALREDPDVIVVGEMRDTETARLALDAAETGHLVIGTMQTTSTAKTLRRLIDSFPAPEQPQVRATVADCLRFVVCQTLIPAKHGGRVPCHEILVMNAGLAFAIREEKDTLIPSLMQMGRHLGMQTMDEALMELLRDGICTGEEAYARAESKEVFEEYVSDAFLQSSYLGPAQE